VDWLVGSWQERFSAAITIIMATITIVGDPQIPKEEICMTACMHARLAPAMQPEGKSCTV
jgi:hypothetical protein